MLLIQSYGTNQKKDKDIFEESSTTGTQKPDSRPKKYSLLYQTFLQNRESQSVRNSAVIEQSKQTNKAAITSSKKSIRRERVVGQKQTRIHPESYANDDLSNDQSALKVIRKTNAYQDHAISSKRYLETESERETRMLNQDEDVRESIQPDRNFDNLSNAVGKQGPPFEYTAKPKLGPTMRQKV